MFRTPHRTKGPAVLGATADGQLGPFGVRSDQDDEPDEQDEEGYPLTGTPGTEDGEGSAPVRTPGADQSACDFEGPA